MMVRLSACGGLVICPMEYSPPDPAAQTHFADKLVVEIHYET